MHVQLSYQSERCTNTPVQSTAKRNCCTPSLSSKLLVYMKPDACELVMWEHISVMFGIQTEYIYSIISFILYLSSSVQLVLVSSYWIFVSTCIGFDHNRLSDIPASLPDLSFKTTTYYSLVKKSLQLSPNFYCDHYYFFCALHLNLHRVR